MQCRRPEVLLVKKDLQPFHRPAAHSEKRVLRAYLPPEVPRAKKAVRKSRPLAVLRVKKELQPFHRQAAQPEKRALP